MKYRSSRMLRQILQRAATAFALVFALVALALPNTAHATETPTLAPPAPPKIGDTAPDFAFVDIATGKPTRFSAFRDRPEFRGKPVVLDFWATWCGPCAGEIPTLDTLHKESGDKKVVVLSITLDTNLKRAKAYIAESKMTWHQGQAPQGNKSAVAKIYASKGIPAVWLIGADGKIAAHSLSSDEIKTALRLHLEKKLEVSEPNAWVKVSGRVENEDGEPIAGAKVSLSVVRKSNIAKGILPDRNNMDEVYITDKNGVWTCERIFTNADDAAIHVSHPDYLGYPITDGRFYVSIRSVNSRSSNPMSDFYKGKTIITLKRGSRLTGVVKDDKGKPVAGAEIFFQEDNFGLVSGLDQSAVTKTNKRGEFSTTVSKDWYYTGIIVAARAKGYAPDTKKISAQQKISGIALILKPPQTIRGIVVNEKGEPLPNTWFAVESWKKVRGVVGSSGKTYTDKEGRFELKDAPEDEVLFAFNQKGYADLRDFPLKAGAENKVVLISATRVHGKVVDAGTGELIKDYTITTGYHENRWQRTTKIHWTESTVVYSGYSAAEINKDGSFQNELTWPHDAYFYRASAKGYYPAVSAPIKMDGKKHEIVIKLRKGKELALKIVDANGNPAVNAEVIFQTKNTEEENEFYQFDTLRFKNGKFADARGMSVTDEEAKLATDASGVITIQPQKKEYRLVISHDSGRAIVHSKELSAEKPVILSPWERIKGKSLTGTKPNAGAEITYSVIERYSNIEGDLSASAGVHWDATAIADKDGNFEIKHALPKLAYLKYEAQKEIIRVVRGEVLNVQLGGKGRIVEGKIILPAALKGGVSWRDGTMFLRCAEGKAMAGVRGNIELVGASEEPAPVPKAASGFWRKVTALADKSYTEAEREKIDLNAYERNKKKNKKMQRQYFEINPDFTFRIGNVLPGEYTLRIRSLDLSVQQTFTIPPDPDGALLDVPLVLPPVKLMP
ncbi:MAG: redoxin domain-containing protein [Puniceicoccales bacterium]|jgi:thiol-disulfide isomerase/thioredoxin|nr:redoxin domain-containing protein [Puniceicoccales bacterium]